MLLVSGRKPFLSINFARFCKCLHCIDVFLLFNVECYVTLSYGDNFVCIGCMMMMMMTFVYEQY